MFKDHLVIASPLSFVNTIQKAEMIANIMLRWLHEREELFRAWSVEAARERVSVTVTAGDEISGTAGQSEALRAVARNSKRAVEKGNGLLWCGLDTARWFCFGGAIYLICREYLMYPQAMKDLSLQKSGEGFCKLRNARVSIRVQQSANVLTARSRNHMITSSSY